MKRARDGAQIHSEDQHIEDKGRTETTMDAMNLLGLTCAVLAALAFGVLLAYTICQAFFLVMRLHARTLRPLAAAPKSAAVVEQQVIQVS